MTAPQVQPSQFYEAVAEEPGAEFARSQRLCLDCGWYHAIRPYLRATNTSAGVHNDWTILEPAAAALIAGGRRRVLIVGSGDTGISALALTAARGQSIALTVIDRCATPLVQIQRMAARHGHRVRTLQQDLLTFDLPEAFDLIIGHQILPFLPPGGPLRLLQQAERSLAPGGRLLLLVRTREYQQWRTTVMAGDADPVEGYAEGIRQAMGKQGIAVPAEAAAFDRLLIDHSRRRMERQRGPRYGTLTEIEADLAAAGMVIEDSSEALNRHGAGHATQLAPSAGKLLVALPRRHAARDA